MTDDQIDTSDIPPLGDDFFARAELRMPKRVLVTMRVDTDLSEWFKAQGEACESLINKALRSYVERHDVQRRGSSEADEVEREPMGITRPPRDALSRAWLFLCKADACPVDARDDCEAFMEAAIVFARAALHRFKTEFEKHSEWSDWWSSLAADPAVQFFRRERDWLLKNAPPRVGQVLRVGGGDDLRAADLYYYDEPDIPATRTIREYLEAFAQTLEKAEHRFATGGRDASE